MSVIAERDVSGNKKLSADLRSSDRSSPVMTNIFFISTKLLAKETLNLHAPGVGRGTEEVVPEEIIIGSKNNLCYKNIFNRKCKTI